MINRSQELEGIHLPLQPTTKCEFCGKKRFHFSVEHRNNNIIYFFCQKKGKLNWIQNLQSQNNE